MDKNQLYLIIIFAITAATIVWAVLIGTRGDRLQNNIGRLSFRKWIVIALSIRLGVIILWSFYPKANATDMSYWIRWMTYLQDHTVKEYYAQGVGDYVPIFVYYLKAVAEVLQKMSLPTDGLMAQLLVKLWAVVFDLVGGYILGVKFQRMDVACLFWLHPAVLWITCIWGQIDVSYTVLLTIALISLYEGKILKACLLTAISTLLKLQTIFIYPVMLGGLICFIVYGDRVLKLQRMRTVIISIIVAVGFGVMITMPCGILNVITQCIKTTTQYPMATLNAPNIWALLNLNKASQATEVIGVQAVMWGNISLVLIAILALGWIFIYQSDHRIRIIYPAMGLYLLSYMFSVRMHERYIFPVLLLMPVYYAIESRKKILLLYLMLSVSCMVNYVSVIMMAGMQEILNRILQMQAVFMMVFTAFYLIEAVNKIVAPRNEKRKQ